MKHEAIYALYPQVTSVDDTAGAFDKDGNQVEIDQAAVDAEIIRLKVKQEAKDQMQINARQSALNKLMALGLTEEEAVALGVRS
jgi:hypothetical protein